MATKKNNDKKENSFKLTRKSIFFTPQMQDFIPTHIKAGVPEPTDWLIYVYLVLFI